MDDTDTYERTKDQKNKSPLKDLNKIKVHKSMHHINDVKQEEIDDVAVIYVSEPELPFSNRIESHGHA